MTAQRNERAKPLILTTSWDDGYPLDMRIADLLQKYRLQGTFYIPTHPAATLLSPAQTRWLAEQFEVAAHTVHHVRLTSIPDADAWRELSECKDQLEQWTGKPCRAFCFPGGRYRRQHLRMLRHCGYEMARTVEFMSIAAPRQRNGIAVMPTSVQVCDHSALHFFRNAATNRRPAVVLRWAQSCRSSDWLAIGCSLLQQAIERGGVFHLWGHSWEIEQHHDWNRLEQMLAAMSGRPGDYVSNSDVCAC